MRKYDCNPVSYPEIPSTHLHPMWQAWDTFVDEFLASVHTIRKPLNRSESYIYHSPSMMIDLLDGSAAQLKIFAAQDTLLVEGQDIEDASKICSNALPITLYSLLHRGLRSFALPLLTVSFVTDTARTLC